jgi:hypothetical protein
LGLLTQSDANNEYIQEVEKDQKVSHLPKEKNYNRKNRNHFRIFHLTKGKQK